MAVFLKCPPDYTGALCGSSVKRCNSALCWQKPGTLNLYSVSHMMVDFFEIVSLLVSPLHIPFNILFHVQIPHKLFYFFNLFFKNDSADFKDAAFFYCIARFCIIII